MDEIKEQSEIEEQLPPTTGGDARPEAETPTVGPPEKDAQPAPGRARVSFRRGPFYAALLPVAFVTGLAAGYLFWGRAPQGGAAQAIAAAPTRPPLDPQGRPRLDVSVDDDPSIGPADAPVTIVEFSDFNCPYCRRFAQDTLYALLDRYPDQIHFVYRDFPVVGGYQAALAANCANEQGAFWEYHDLLYSGRLELGRSAYTSYAQELGLDTDALDACIDEERYADEVQADANEAASLGATGTPTFFINGIPFVGAQPLSSFTSVIDSELSR